MAAKIIDGKAMSEAIRAEAALEAEAFEAATGGKPGLTVILVGDDPASQVYVRNKGKACEEAGFYTETIRLPADSTHAAVAETIERLNADPRVHGILLQLPVPPQVDGDALVRTISPEKDVDGLHPINAGRLALGAPGFVPCTPAGVIEMLRRSGIQTSGKIAVVVGRSSLVGRPVATLLSNKGEWGDATVVACHSRTKDLNAEIARADILIAAIGRPRMIDGRAIKPGAAVIDVGINRIEDASTKSGFRLVGDVDYDSAKEVAGWITPVPGGVGPMTIAMLLKNTLTAARRSAGIS